MWYSCSMHLTPHSSGLMATGLCRGLSGSRNAQDMLLWQLSISSCDHCVVPVSRPGVEGSWTWQWWSCCSGCCGGEGLATRELECLSLQVPRT